MARLEKKIILEEDGAKREFVVKQMPATQGFIFGVKVVKFLCSNDGNADKTQFNNIPEMFIAAIGGMDFKAFESIMNEALECCTHIGASQHTVCTRDKLDMILTDPLNVFELFKASLEINLSFIQRALPEHLKEKMRGGLQSLLDATTQNSTPA